MRLENETTSVEDVISMPFKASEFSLQTDDKNKLITEIGNFGKRFSILENSLLTLPPHYVFNDIKTKLKAGFERWIFGTRELRIYIFPFSNLSILPKINKFNRNSIEDIFLYQQTSLGQPTRQNFLKLSRQRFEKGMNVYTFVEDNVLQAYIWMDPNPQTYYGSGVDQEIVTIPNSIYVQDAYTNPFARAKGLGQAGFCQLAHDAAKISDKNCLYLAIFGKNTPSRHAAEKLGSILQTSYFCKTRFGFRKTWKIENSAEYLA